MKTKTLQSLLAVLLILALAGCATPADPAAPVQKPGSASGPNAGPPDLSGLNRDQLASYSATFDIKFTGPASWGYQLKTRRSPALREEALHIDGIDKARNPGDVRLVTDGKSTRMLGPGTDNECVQFPNGQGMDPTLIYPETLLPFESLAGKLAFVGEEPLAGKTSLHFSGTLPAIGGWSDARVEVWQDKASLALLRLTLQASGEDAFFGSGSGKVVASYTVEDFNPSIQPVEGCTIAVPLPGSAQNVVRLPGMASFDSAVSKEEVSAFYQSALPKESWAEKEPAAQSEGAIILSYNRGQEEVEIHIETAASGGSQVRLLFGAAGQ